MRLCNIEDLPQLEILYNQAIEHAEVVGHIDWPKPFPDHVIEGYIKENELYCFEKDLILVAAIRITRYPNTLIWPEVSRENAFYGGKAATSKSVRSENYGRNVILPEMIEFSRNSGVELLRGDSLADNPRLANYYSDSGFQNMGNTTFYSVLQQKELTVTRWQLEV